MSQHLGAHPAICGQTLGGWQEEEGREEGGHLENPGVLLAGEPAHKEIQTL